VTLHTEDDGGALHGAHAPARRPRHAHDPRRWHVGSRSRPLGRPGSVTAHRTVCPSLVVSQARQLLLERPDSSTALINMRAAGQAVDLGEVSWRLAQGQCRPSPSRSISARVGSGRQAVSHPPATRSGPPANADRRRARSRPLLATTPSVSATISSSNCPGELVEQTVWCAAVRQQRRRLASAERAALAIAVTAPPAKRSARTVAAPASRGPKRVLHAASRLEEAVRLTNSWTLRSSSLRIRRSSLS
jgi:hypothetical protein